MVSLPLSPSCWTIDQITVDGYVVVAELHPSVASAIPVAAEPGRVASNPDVVAGPLTIALIDVPDVLGLALSNPTVLLAASNATSGWKSRSVELGFSGQTIATATARSKSVLGTALSVLAQGGTDLADDRNSVEVTLVDPDQWLTSCDDGALAAGENMAVLGSELLQFGQATPLGEGRFRLTHLLRGRGGTEWACTGHAAGETFCVLQPGSLQSIALPLWTIGAALNASGAGANASVSFTGESVRPRSPVSLTADFQASGDLLISWIRRSRQGFAWLDEIDAPLGETTEQYRVVITGTAGASELTSNAPDLAISGELVASLGLGPVTIEVRQIGDFGTSRPTQISINMS